MLKNRISLIPRYNWDFKIGDLVSCLLSLKSNIDDDIWSNIFNKKPILTTSGRASLYAILKSMDIKNDSYIGVPLYCCPVVFDTIKKAGFRPLFIDIDKNDYNISIDDIEKKKDRISTLLVVHMFGNPVNIDDINNKIKGIPIIEDCAQSLYSKYNNQFTGFNSVASFYSFRSGKYISAGEGSAIFTNDNNIRKKIESYVEKYEEWTTLSQIKGCITTYIKSLMYKRPYYGIIGMPIGRMLDRKLNLTAKSGIELKKISNCFHFLVNSRLKYFEKRIGKQRENTYYLLSNLDRNNIGELENINKTYEVNYYQLPMRFKSPEERDKIFDYLLNNGIDTAKYLDEVVDIAYKEFEYKGDCPVSEECSKTVLVIPNHYCLRRKDLDKIILRLTEIYNKE